MPVIRAFIAIELSKDLHQPLQQVSDTLQEEMQDLPLRWVPVTNIHLTLKFLGDVSETNLDLIKEMLQGEARQHKPFEIGIGNLGAFPNMARPRVTWVDVEVPDEVFVLQRRIVSQVSRLGYAPDKKEFNPHLTLARVSRNATPLEIRGIGEVLRKQKIGYLGAARITEVVLYRSDLQKDGAVYTKLLSAPLSAG